MVQRWYRTDVRGVLPAVHVPTLVLHSSGDPMESPESARYLASHIAGAKLELVEGRDHLPFGSQRPAVVEAVRRFVAQVQAEQATLERVLATVLFTDIVGSTERMAELGDTGWRDLVTGHHATVRAPIWQDSAVERSTRRVMGSSSRSTVRRERLPAPGR